MKPEKILYAMNDIDGQFLREARQKTVQPRRHSRRFTVLIAAVIALMAISITAFAAEEIAGWFRQYFAGQSDAPLTPGQIQFIEENEQVIEETQEHNGYSLELKSILSDSNTVYVIVGITAPSDVTAEDMRSLWGSDIDFYDENNKPVGSWGVKLHVGMDDMENTADLVFEMNPADWNEGKRWTLRINSLGKLVHNKEYEQELLDTKYAGQENIMFTDEEAAKIHQQVILAEGPWEFAIDLSKVENKVLELIAEPVVAQTCYGFKEDGTDLFKDVTITSFELSPLSATILTDCDYAPDFTAGGRKVYVVMTDGSRIQLHSNWASVGTAHMNPESPIILDEVDYVLLSDGTKLLAP